jgi:putative hemolysin
MKELVGIGRYGSMVIQIDWLAHKEPKVLNMSLRAKMD